MKKKKPKVTIIPPEEVTLIEPPIKRWRREDAMRQAEVAFITDEDKHPPEFWWQKLCADVIPLRTFKYRVDKGRWIARRDRYWRSVVQEILRKSKYRAVHDRVKELNEIQAIRDNTLELLQPTILNGQKFFKVQPSTYEGVINALVKLDALGDAKRDAVLEMIEPDLAREEMGEERTLFTHEEMADLSRHLLESRMRKQQARIEAHRASLREDNDGDDED